MDGSANPYLLQASVLAAGLDGLKNKIVTQENHLIVICTKILKNIPICQSCKMNFRNLLSNFKVIEI